MDTQIPKAHAKETKTTMLFFLLRKRLDYLSMNDVAPNLVPRMQIIA